MSCSRCKYARYVNAQNAESLYVNTAAEYTRDSKPFIRARFKGHIARISCGVVGALLVFVGMMQAPTLSSAYAAVDAREAAHGLSYISNPASKTSYLIWSDQYATGSTPDGSWQHNLFYQTINTAHPKIAGKTLLISAREAQEPASAAVAKNGNVIVSFEDGNTSGYGGLSQCYAIFDKNMQVVKQYPNTIGLGGHSGHASAVGNRFVVAWNEGWSDGGGVDNLGAGQSIYVTSLSASGTRKKTCSVAVHKGRNGWPMVAGGAKRALVVWQKCWKSKSYTQVRYAIYNPKTNKLSKVRGSTKTGILPKIKGKYYTHSVVWLTKQKRFVVSVTTHEGKGAIFLINEKGKIVSKRYGVTSFVREGAPAIKVGTKTSTLCYPRASKGAAWYKISKNNIKLVKVSKKGKNWSYRGTAGFWSKNGKHVYFTTLGARRVSLVKF